LFRPSKTIEEPGLPILPAAALKIHRDKPALRPSATSEAGLCALLEIHTGARRLKLLKVATSEFIEGQDCALVMQFQYSSMRMPFEMNKRTKFGIDWLFQQHFCC
jgi:hypothetical protein